MCVQACVHAWVGVCTCICIHPCFGMCLRVCISACVWMRVGAYKFIYFLACDSAYLHMRMCARVRVCVRARARVFVCGPSGHGMVDS